MNQLQTHERVRGASGWVGVVGVLLMTLMSASGASAQETTAAPKNTVEGQLVLALPAGALSTGMSVGAGAKYMRVATRGGLLAWGAGASWSTATEYSTGYAVRNDDIRMRLYGQIQRGVGRGLFGLRVGAGATLVYESLTLVQGARAQLPSCLRDSTAWVMLPAADIEGIVVLRVWKSWGMSVSGGPTLHWLDSGLHAGWTSELGVTWQH